MSSRARGLSKNFALLRFVGHHELPVENSLKIRAQNKIIVPFRLSLDAIRVN